MRTVQIQFELPEELARQLDPSGKQLGRRILELALLRLVQDGVISSGKAAEVLGVPLADFWRLMHQHRVPYFDLTPEELREELEASKLAEARREA